MNSTEQTDYFEGKDFEILEMVLKNSDTKIDLSWKLRYENKYLHVTFYNVHGLRMENLSSPLMIHGLAIDNNSQTVSDRALTYVFHDSNDDRIKFFCECMGLRFEESDAS